MAETPAPHAAPEVPKAKIKAATPAVPEAAPSEAPPSEPAAPVSSIWTKLNPRVWFRKETPKLWVAEGDRLLEMGNRNQALVAYHKALALDPDCANGHRGLGRVTLGRGGRTNAQAALVHFQEAARFNPYDDRIYQATAIAYERMGKGHLAQAERKKMAVLKALQVNATDPVANNNLGVLFAQQDQGERAIECFKKATNANRKYDAGYRNLATTYYRMATSEKDSGKKGGLLDHAAATIAVAVKLNPVAMNVLAQARILLGKGDANRALDAVAKAEAAEPSNPQVYLVKREAFEKLGRMTDAQRAHEQYVSIEKARKGGAA
jgi:tetratricopeptide (TPR) repeat protein